MANYIITILHFIKDHSILEIYPDKTNSFISRQPEVQVKSNIQY